MFREKRDGSGVSLRPRSRRPAICASRLEKNPGSNTFRATTCGKGCDRRSHLRLPSTLCSPGWRRPPGTCSPALSFRPRPRLSEGAEDAACNVLRRLSVRLWAHRRATGPARVILSLAVLAVLHTEHALEQLRVRDRSRPDRAHEQSSHLWGALQLGGKLREG